MERYSMFLGWKNQYCENDYTTQSNLQIQCNRYQITNGIFYRTRIQFYHLCGNTEDSKYPKQFWERKIELEESGSMTLGYPTKLQSSRYYGMKIEMYLSEQDRMLRDKPTYL